MYPVMLNQVVADEAQELAETWATVKAEGGTPTWPTYPPGYHSRWGECGELPKESSKIISDWVGGARTGFVRNVAHGGGGFGYTEQNGYFCTVLFIKPFE